MNEIFTPSSKTIRQVFEGSVYYEVPSYQRPYSWDDEHIEDLWDDIFGAFEEGDSEYFLGSIILTKNQNNKYLDVIDGQQRLTTLIILFCCLRDLYYKDHNDPKKRNMILGRIKDLESDNERLKLRTQARDQIEFEQKIINSIDFNEKISKNEIKSNKFLNTAYIFKDKIEQLKEKDPNLIEKFTEYLLDRVRVVAIECSDRSFAIKLFQILNDRGLDLTPADLIKSYLMGRLNEEDFLAFEADWNFIESKTKEFDEKLTDLFIYYEYYLLASNPKKSLYEELEKQFKNKEPKEIIHEFKKLIRIFDNILNEKSKIIYSLNYLRHGVYWKSILISARLKEWDKKSFDELAKILRKYYYLYWVADYTTSKIKQTSFNLINWIKSGKDIKYISEELNKIINKDKVMLRVITGLNGDIYNSPWGKPLLVLIEYQQTDESNINFIDLDKVLHVEHILPQAYSKIPYWSERFSHQSAEVLINTLGNLTLLSGKKNIDASNKPFPDKINIYNGKGIDGLTGFIITQNIFNESKNDLDWTREKIDLRKEWVLNQIENLFDIDLDEDFQEEDEESYTNQSADDLYNVIQNNVLKIADDIIIEQKKFYKAFKVGIHNFLTVKKQRNRLRLRLRINPQDDPKKIGVDISSIGEHGTGKYRIIINSVEEINEYLLNLIKKSYGYIKK